MEDFNTDNIYNNDWPTIFFYLKWQYLYLNDCVEMDDGMHYIIKICFQTVVILLKTWNLSLFKKI